METKRVIVDGVTEDPAFDEAVALLKAGEVVAFPTETVYGLGGIATNDAAVTAIYAAKGRPSDNPLIVHIGAFDQLERYVDNISEKAKKCMDAFWPGPLTVICHVKPGALSEKVTAGLDTVGIRMPNHPVALRLLRQLDEPVAAPSANTSGKPSPTEGVHVEEDLTGRIPLILDGGATGIGVESTVIDLTLNPPTILRPGGITKEMFEAVIGPVNEPTHIEQKAGAPKAPGMKYTHYAPDTPVLLIDNDEVAVKEALAALHADGKKVALLAPDHFGKIEADWFFTFGDGTHEQMAAHLYDALRACNATDADVVLATVTDKNDMGSAIMNRLEKSAGGHWYEG